MSGGKCPGGNVLHPDTSAPVSYSWCSAVVPKCPYPELDLRYTEMDMYRIGPTPKRWRMRVSSNGMLLFIFCCLFSLSVRRFISEMNSGRRTRWSDIVWLAWRDWKTTRAFLSVRFRGRTNCFKSCLLMSTKSFVDSLWPVSRIQGLRILWCWRPTSGYAEPYLLYREQYWPNQLFSFCSFFKC